MDDLIRKVLDVKANPGLYLALKTFYAPWTEEPAKLVPLFILFVRQSLRRENISRVALCIGLGFGLGEAWYLASEVALNQPLRRICE